MAAVHVHVLYCRKDYQLSEHHYGVHADSTTATTPVSLALPFRKMSSHTNNTKQSPRRKLAEKEATASTTTIRREKTTDECVQMPIAPSSTLDMHHRFGRAGSMEQLSIPALPNMECADTERQYLAVPSTPALQLSGRSALEDSSSSTEETPYRSRSHAVDLMGLNISSLRCRDDATTGRHFVRVGATEIEHPAHHRRVSSSSRVAFAVAAYYAEQREAALSEKAADDDNDEEDDDDIVFEVAPDMESQASESSDLGDQFSFWEDYSCSCCDQEVCVRARRKIQDDQDSDGEDELHYEGQEQDIEEEDKDFGHKKDQDRCREDSAVMADDKINRALLNLSLTETPRTPSSSSNRRKTELEQSPVSISSFPPHTTSNISP